MKSILYLWIMSLKNSILELRKKPGILILYLVFLALIVGMIVLSKHTTAENGLGAGLEVLKGFFLIFVVLYFIFGVKRGLASGGSFFDMSDVNFLFVSPVNPRVILVHGIARQIKIAFLAGMFILFQSNNLKVNFGVELSGMFYMFIGFILSAVLSEILAMFIYSTTNGSRKRQRLVKVIAVLFFVPAAATFGLAYVRGAGLYGAFLQTVNSWAVDGIPVLGWTTRGFMDLIQGQYAHGVVFFCMTALTGVALVMIIALRRSDYYEDVLVATETNYEKTRAKMEGDINAITSGRKVKVAKTGLSGEGASAIFGKHMRETLRENPMKLFSTTSIFFIVGAVVFALFTRSFGSSLTVLQILMWVQLFLVGSGRGLKELFNHYIYLIPEGAVAKMVWSNMEAVMRTVAEAVVLFLLIGILFREDLGTILGCMAAYSLFTLLLLSVNYLSMRVFKDTINYGLLLFFYVIGVVVLLAPGLVAAVIVGSMTTAFVGLIILSGWEFGVALLCFQLSKGVLHRCDMLTMTKK